MYNVEALCVLSYIYLFFGLYIYEHFVTQLQHVLLGILSVRQHHLKESVAKAIGYGWKVHLRCLPIPAEAVKSNISSTFGYCIIWTIYLQNFKTTLCSGKIKRQCNYLTHWLSCIFEQYHCDMKDWLILYSPPHSVAIELKELEDIMGSFSEFGLLLGSQCIIGYKH